MFVEPVSRREVEERDERGLGGGVGDEMGGAGEEKGGFGLVESGGTLDKHGFLLFVHFNPRSKNARKLTRRCSSKACKD